jgi:chromosome segregation ATPase
MTDTQPLEQELQAARDDLAALRQRDTGILAETGEATRAEDFDADRLLDLERESEMLPKRILAAEAKVLSLRLKIMEAEQPDLIAAARELEPVVATKRKALAQAQAEFNDANGRYQQASSNVQTARLDMAEVRRNLQDTVGKLQAPRGAVVRSMIHA